MNGDGIPVLESLTDRELEILRLIADGLSNQEIADQLCLSLETVKWYNKQSYQKLGVRSRTQAIARARALGWLGSIPEATNNLPSQSTAFVGREAELAEIGTRLVNPGCRLLTLVGPGGIGKTRLAIEVARQQLTFFPEGIFFVSLASIESPAFVVPTLANVLTLPQTGQQDPLAQIINYLREKKSLLVFDSFEHLREGAQLLSELIARSRRAKLLVTSRERLCLREEWLFDVRGLSYPSPDVPEQRIENPTHYEAVQLFLNAAQKVQSEFSLNANNSAHIMRICQLVEGMPLAIELAASWVRVLSCRDIARELGGGLALLSTSVRGVPERHRSIQAVLDHSWKMLSDTEHIVFSKLTVFSGSLQREAAASIAGASLDILLGLIDKSFLQRVNEDRFAIHALVKQFGNAKLRGNNDVWMQTRLQHCQYFADYLHQRMSEPDNLQYLGEIEAEFDDIQLAWRFAVETEQLDRIQQLVTDLWSYYQLRSWYRAGTHTIGLYEQVLAHFEMASEYPNRDETIFYLCESLGSLYVLKSMYDEAMAFYNRALVVIEEDRVWRGRILRQIGDVWVTLNDHANAQSAYRQAEAALERVTQRSVTWWTEWTHLQVERMWLYYWANRPEDMMALDDQIRVMIEQHSLAAHRVRYLNAMALMSLRRDRYYYSEDAIEYTRRALSLSIESENLSEIAWTNFLHGFCHLWSNHLAEAEKFLLISQEMTEENGDLILLTRTLTYLSVVYRKQGDVVGAREHAEYDLEIAKEAQMPQYVGSALAQLAWVAWCDGDVVAAERDAKEAIESWDRLGMEQTIAPFRWLALFPLMGVALQQQNMIEAVNCARHLLKPPQQRLPDELARLLKEAIAANEQNCSEMTSKLLHEAFKTAHAMAYV
jgi:DNA-binding CsgD family transcriptional regulator/tetratricopeptide (TPR) repeat protein